MVRFWGFGCRGVCVLNSPLVRVEGLGLQRVGFGGKVWQVTAAYRLGFRVSGCRV